MSELNRIYVNSNLVVENGYSNTLCFIDGLAMDKSRYTLENNELSIYKEAQDYISVFYNTNSSSTYYFDKILNEYGIIIFGKDKQGKKLTGLRNDNLMIFVDGVLLRQDEYKVLDNSNVSLFVMRNDTIFHDVIIYVSNLSIVYGVLNDPMNINKESDKNPNNPENKIGYSRNNTIIFRNGRYVSPDLIDTVNGYTFVKFVPNKNDKFTYCKISNGTISINFEATKGVTTYGPTDDYKITIPNLYDSSVSFDDLAKVVVDDLRPGFIICEKDRAGRLLVAETNYETNKIKTITLEAFSNNVYTKDEYYLEVPESKSITDYLSDYDQRYIMLPEILRIFQRVLLDEIHDEIERVKNIRNIRKVDSEHIYKLLRLLGMDLDIKHLNIKQMQEAIEELTEFYRIAGTKHSLNYFNIVQDNTKLINVKPLYTFHKKRQKKEENKVYSYSYALYTNGETTYGGTNYVPGEQYRVLNERGEETNIIVNVKEVGENGELFDGGFVANIYEGRTPYSSLPLDITTNSVGAVLDCVSYPYLYDYSSVVTCNDAGGFSAGDVLKTPLYDGQVIVDTVDSVGKITSAHITKTQGTTSYDNIVNTPLQPESEETSLKLVIQAKNLNYSKVHEVKSAGTGTFKVDETALYKITFSGAGGSGGAADTAVGSINDSPASAGYRGELKSIIIPCSEGTTLTYKIGAGGKPSYARGDGSTCYCGKGGDGGDPGKMGYNKTDNMMGTRRKKWNGSTKYYCCLVNGVHYHGDHYRYSKAASGAGGGGSCIEYNGKTYTARGGNGGNATWSNNQHEDANKELVGGLGGYGGTTQGLGAKGGKRNDDDTFMSGAGEDGYITIEKITQVYNENMQLLNNDNLSINAGTVLKTTDKDNMFTLTVDQVSDGRITEFRISPFAGTKPIYHLDSNGNIDGYSQTFDLVNVSKEAFLTINQTVNQYTYSLNIKNSNGVYKSGQTLTSENGLFTIRTEYVPDGTIESFSYTPTSGSENINFENDRLITTQGSGAKLVITSSSDVDVQNIEREYVDFYLPEEQGAVWHKEYRIPMEDYGYVNQGSPGSPQPWTPGYPDIDYGDVSEGSPNAPYPYDVYDTETRTIYDDTGIEQYNITKTDTIKGPIGNPDIDYGLVSEKIKGQWVEWMEWDRPADLYPTNHVEVEVNILSVEDYDKAMARFYKQFYSLASTVLYIHRLVTVYNFGNNTTASITEDAQDTSGSMILMGFMTTQPVEIEVHTMTCDPQRQSCYKQEI